MTPEEQTEEKREQAFQRAVSALQEWYPDFLVMVRPKSGDLYWHSTDPTWAVGAATVYIEHVNTDNYFKLSNYLDRENKEGNA